jgi:hypothetical protein
MPLQQRGGLILSVFRVSPSHHLRAGDSIDTSLPARASLKAKVLAVPGQGRGVHGNSAGQALGSSN